MSTSKTNRHLNWDENVKVLNSYAAMVANIGVTYPFASGKTKHVRERRNENFDRSSDTANS